MRETPGNFCLMLLSNLFLSAIRRSPTWSSWKNTLRVKNRKPGGRTGDPLPPRGEERPVHPPWKGGWCLGGEKSLCGRLFQSQSPPVTKSEDPRSLLLLLLRDSDPGNLSLLYLKHGLCLSRDISNQVLKLNFLFEFWKEKAVIMKIRSNQATVLMISFNSDSYGEISIVTTPSQFTVSFPLSTSRRLISLLRCVSSFSLSSSIFFLKQYFPYKSKVLS